MVTGKLGTALSGVWLRPRGYSIGLTVGRPGFDFLVEPDQNTLKMVFTASLLGAQHLKG